MARPLRDFTTKSRFQNKINCFMSDLFVSVIRVFRKSSIFSLYRS